MRNLITIFLISLLSLIAGCSTYVEVERAPSQAESEIFNSVFSIPASVAGKTSHLELAKKQFDGYVNQGGGYPPKKNTDAKYELIASKSLGKGEAFHIELDIDPKTSQMVYRVYHAPNAFKDDIASYAMIDFVSKLMTGENLDKKQAVFEMYYNAKKGDPIALDAFLKIREQEHLYFYDNNDEIFKSDEYLKAQKGLKEYRSELAVEIKALKVKRAKDKTKRKALLDALDKAPENKQFRALIAAGNREAAAGVLKKYLPWEEMAPFEKEFWETYLEVIAKPVPLEQRILIYRGLDEDYIHRSIVKGKELTEKEAITEGKAFVMSSGMVKNQGSWNRRLRSLEAMNGKFIGTLNGSEEYAQSARITTMFLNHSAEPKGSPFLSFTPKLSVAESFGGERVSAYLIDPRLLHFNYASSFESEIEYLVPLSTFPDELVGIADRELLPDNLQYARNQYLEERLEKMIAAEYGEAKKKEIITKIKKNSYTFFKGEYAEMPEVAGKSPAASNLAFYKKFLTKDDPKPTISPKGEMNCKDLIEIFWMAN